MWTAIFNGIGEASTQFFKILPGIGIYIDFIFIILGSLGTLYWIYYEYSVNKGKENFLSKR
jgi:hypothetical protein